MPKKIKNQYETTRKIRGHKREVAITVYEDGTRSLKMLNPKIKKSEEISMEDAKKIYKEHRQKLDKDIRTRSKKVLKKPNRRWARNPSKLDVEGIDTPSALRKHGPVEYCVAQHPYKAGKAWISKATKRWGIKKDKAGNALFLKAHDISKEGNWTTKCYKLEDGRYLANSSGSKSYQKRTRLKIEKGEIVEEDSSSIK